MQVDSQSSTRANRRRKKKVIVAIPTQCVQNKRPQTPRHAGFAGERGSYDVPPFYEFLKGQHAAS